MAADTQKIYRTNWEFDFPSDADSFEELKGFLDSSAERKAVLSEDDIHPEMPYDGNLMKEVEVLEEEGADIDSITWYQVDPHEIVEEDKWTAAKDYLGIRTVKDFLGINNRKANTEEVDYRELFDSSDHYSDIYAINGFTHCAVLGDIDAADRASTYFERSWNRNRTKEKAKELYRRTLG